MKFTITREQLQEGLVAVAASVPSKDCRQALPEVRSALGSAVDVLLSTVSASLQPLARGRLVHVEKRTSVSAKAAAVARRPRSAARSAPGAAPTST